MQKKEREGMDRGGKRKYIKIRQLEEKLSQKRREPTGCKYIRKIYKTGSGCCVRAGRRTVIG